MSIQIILLRGVNVGGRNRLPMEDLRHIAIAAGAEAAQTYLQSGNLVIRGAADCEAISDAIQNVWGFRPACITRTPEDWQRVIDANPFPALCDPRTLHVFFMAESTAFTAEELREFALPGEDIHITSHHAYVKTPLGLAGSRIIRRIERAHGSAVTARNWPTVLALKEVADQMASV